MGRMVLEAYPLVLFQSHPRKGPTEEASACTSIALKADQIWGSRRVEKKWI